MKIILTENKIREQICIWQPKVCTAKGNIGTNVSPIIPNEVWLELRSGDIMLALI